MRNPGFKIFILLFFTFGTPGQSQEYPHILVSKSEKTSILLKIEKQSWAGKIFEDMSDNVTPYAERHVNDPEWILSRYLMNRIPGKRYTRVYSDNGGLRMVKSEGSFYQEPIIGPCLTGFPDMQKPGDVAYRR